MPIAVSRMLASVSMLLSCYTQGTSVLRQANFLLSETSSSSDMKCCFMLLQKVAVCPNRVTLEFRRSKEKEQPPARSFLIMLKVYGEFGGGVFDLLVPLRASLRWECSVTAVVHVSSD